jgi:hypothetical protein
MSAAAPDTTPGRPPFVRARRVADPPTAAALAKVLGRQLARRTAALAEAAAEVERLRLANVRLRVRVWELEREKRGGEAEG